MPAKAKIRTMFDSIAADYDRLNHVLSLDVDRTWRKKALKEVAHSAPLRNREGWLVSGVEPPGSIEVLDLACGTGDFSIEIARHLDRVHVTGVDLSEGMLAVMKEKVNNLCLEEAISIETGDGEHLRFADGTFDRVTNAFGIRNFEDRQQGLREALRVLKPGGRLIILELSRPENRFLRRLYDLYFLRILPKIGGRISGEKEAYAYLPASVKTFPGKKEFTAMMRQAGFEDVRHKTFTFGVCRMYTGDKPK